MKSMFGVRAALLRNVFVMAVSAWAVVGAGRAEAWPILKPVKHSQFCAWDEATYVADYNRDGISDVLCASSWRKRMLYGAAGADFGAGGSWSVNDTYCTHPGAKMYVGDFFGGGGQDLLCHDTAGNRWIKYMGSGTSWWEGSMYFGGGFCGHAGSQLFLGDFNGDKRSDLLCHDRNTGEKWVILTDHWGSVDGSRSYFPIKFCNHAGAQLHIADADGDGRDDLLCQDTNNGDLWVALNYPLFGFMGVSWYGPRAGSFCLGRGGIRVADYNGDQRDDLACWDRGSSGLVQFRFGSSGRYDSPIQSSYATVPANTSVFHATPAKVNSDGHMDLLLWHY